MSRRKLREDKKCLNCGHFVEERFCSRCGQENVEEQPKFSYLFTAFFQNMFGYDSALWRTLKSLFSKPGQASKDYLDGKRKTYVPPIRLYLFSSFLLFLFMAVFPEPNEPLSEQPEVTVNGNKITSLSELDSLKSAADGDEKIDSIEYQYARAVLLNPLKKDSVYRVYASMLKKEVYINVFGSYLFVLKKDSSGWFTHDDKYRGMRSVKDFDRIHESLPKRERLSGLEKRMVRKTIKLDESEIIDRGEYQSKASNLRIKNLPKLMFFYLPVFAWLIWLFYRPKNYYKSGVFTLYYFSFLFLLGSFLVLLIYGILPLLLNKNPDFYDIWIWIARGLTAITFIVGIIYFFKSQKEVYESKKRYNWLKGFGIIFFGVLLFLVYNLVFNVIIFLLV